MQTPARAQTLALPLTPSLANLTPSPTATPTPTRCALLLALVMALSALYKHPWFITMWSKSTFALDFVVGFEDTYVDAWLYSDHQRYFFFQVGDIEQI